MEVGDFVHHRWSVSSLPLITPPLFRRLRLKTDLVRTYASEGLCNQMLTLSRSGVIGFVKIGQTYKSHTRKPPSSLHNQIITNSEKHSTSKPASGPPSSKQQAASAAAPPSSAASSPRASGPTATSACGHATESPKPIRSKRPSTT